MAGWPLLKTQRANMKLLAVLMLVVALPALAESKIVCTVQTEEPIALQMINGWGATDVNASPGTYYKDVTGVVRLSGMIWKFTGPSQGFVTVLPVGYRPSKPEWFTVASQGGTADVVVFATGEVQVFEDFGYFTWVSLSGITFRAN
jgi:hypothetical protein